MSSHSRSLLRLQLGFLLCFGGLRPLCAQFSQLPATQTALRPSGSTDFLDLYTQSSSEHPMPEIMTIFDSSFSMNSLMFHPLYVNNDLQDADDYRSMQFSLTGSGVAYTNTYTIVASNSNCPATFNASGQPNGGSYAAYTVTVTSTSIATKSVGSDPVGCYTAACTTPPNIQILAYAGGDSTAQTELVFVPNSTGTSYTLSSTYTNPGPETNSSSANSYTMETSSNGTSGTYPNPGSSAPTIKIIGAQASKTNTTPVSAPYPAGSYIIFQVYMAHTMVTEPAESSSDSQIGWQANLVSSCSDNNAGSISTLTNAPSPSGQSSFWVSTAGWTIPTWTSQPATGTPQQLEPIALASGSPAVAPGNIIQLVTYFEPGDSTGNITWTTVAGANNCSAAQTVVNPVLKGGTGNVTTAGTTLTSAQVVTWTVPSTFCTGTTNPSYTVTVTLNPTKGANYTAPGVTYLTGTLSAATNSNGASDATSVLRKPDGTAVMASDAAAAVYNSTASTTLNYATYGAADVRNWIRAASHVRFKATVGSYTRYVDIPIPWKIMDVTSFNNAGGGSVTQNPLPSTKLLDQTYVTSVLNGSVVTTYYGSQLPPATTPGIEIDSTYLVENAPNGVLASTPVTSSSGGQLNATSALTSVYLYGVVYRPAYISWLFTGTYGSAKGTYNGQSSTVGGSLNYTSDTGLTAAGKNFIVYDAATPSLVPGQLFATWGQGFGPAAKPWGNIKVPAYADPGSGVQSGADQTLDGSTFAIPALTRLQAVKNAAISTWIQNQGGVYWAFRELDPSSTEANAGTGTTFNNNSSTSLNASNPTTTHLAATDSGWTVLNNTPSQITTTTTGNTVNVLSSSSGNSVKGMTRIAYMFATGETPLTYAIARGLAQYSDPNNIFGTVEGSNVGQCLESFLMLFTDGIDNNAINGVNNPNLLTPYISYGSGVPQSLSPVQGNQAILASKGLIDPTGGSDWNIFTFAGVGAHMADSTLGAGNFMPAPRTSAALGSLENYPTSSVPPDQFLPFALPSRGSVSFTADHLITTMTVGVSLGGFYNNPASPKANLFNAAVVGNPLITSGNFGPSSVSTNFHAFSPPVGSYTTTVNGNNIVYTLSSDWKNNDWSSKSGDPGDYPVIGQAAPGAVYFFDGSNPTSLANAMYYAFRIAASTSANHATASPNIPFVGAALGNEIYLGNFFPPSTGGVVWPGDLMMFATTDINGVLSYVDQNGAPTTNLNSSTAQWDAATVMASTPWQSRNLYTRYPATAAAPGEPAISKWPSWTSSAFTSGTDPIFSNVDPPTSTTGLANQQLVLEFAAGGDTSLGAMPATNRSNIMGDIINSVPAAVGYNLSQLTLPGTLAGVENPTGFNLILVGTNQGWLQAFGEVTSKKQVGSTTLTTGTIQELWAFMPTDFLNDLEYITQKGNPHLHMVDGSPAIYFLDLPPSGSGTGNGLVDSNEHAVAIISLGKGGRSYYALDIHNPITPALLWSLVPDESAFFPSSRIVTGGPSMATVQGILQNMGYSTCVPAFGRIQFKGVLHDCVFLGGGLSTPAVDAGFTGTAPSGLGRSVLALDVYSGAVLGAVDLTVPSIGGTPDPTTGSTIGCIPTGVIPFEFILNSGMAERAYFMDYTGGLWSWGSKNVSSAAGYNGFRIDTPEMTNLPSTLPSGWAPWQIRKVFQDDNTGSSLGGKNNRYTTLPAPWVVSSFPGYAYHSGNVPAAVGIAMISGDRNNPLDSNYTSTTTPKQHQLTVVFDRQDSRNLGLDNAAGTDPLAGGSDTGIRPNDTLLVSLSESPLTSTPTDDLTDPVFDVFTPGSSNFYLGTSTAAKYGYYFLLPSISNKFVPKGINTPLVDANTLFYSFFTPTSSDPCTGGTGYTFSGTIANVMDPIFDDTRSNISLPSTGWIPGTSVAQWNGVTSNFFAIGTTSVVQGGTITTPAGGTAMALQSWQTTQTSLFPKIRVWRSVTNVP
jgi:hypothetical protein